MIELDDIRLERYSRNILLKDVGIEGQQKLFDAKVLLVGAGGLGSPAALYLGAAGVGTIGIADGDRVDVSNLQRQIAHTTQDVGRPKAESAADKIRAINPDVQVRVHGEFLTAENALEIIRQYDFVIDGTDSFAAKFLVNDACVLAGVPYSHGGILRFDGQTMTVRPRRSACYRCVFRSPPPRNAVPTCSQAGILGAVAGMLGTIQAAEALKVILETGTPLTDALLTFDSLKMAFRRVPLHRDPQCPVCGDQPTITTLVDIEQPACDLRRPAGKEGAS